MPIFRKSFEQIKAMLAQMTFSQQMLIVMLGLVIVGCVVWMARFSGTSDMVPVFDQAFDSGEQSRLASALAAAGIAHDVSGGKVLVASGQRERAQVALAANDALPRDFSLGFEQVVKDSNIWRSETEKDRMWKVAVENELAAVLRQFPGVRDAKVIVDRAEKAGFGRTASPAGSAAVHLRMKPGSAIDKKLVTAVADWVSGAVRDLTRDRVRVVDSTSGRSYRVPGEDAAVPSDLLELATQYEKHFAESIRTAIGHIDNVLVSVSVKVEPTSRQETALRVDKGNAVSVPASERSSKTSSNEAPAGAEPGVASNTGVAIAAGAPGSGSARSESEEETRYESKIGETRIVTTELPGALRDLSASVNIPRSFFVAALRAETGVEQVDPAALKDFIIEQVAKIRPKVLAAIGLTEKTAGEKVAVGWYYDTVVPRPQAEAQAEASGALPSLLGSARTIGLGALAIVSLGMMLLMIRKAAAAVVGAAVPIGPAAAAPGEAISYAAEGVVGEAGIADGYLQGMEVDEETLRTQKMVEQVAAMVKENPDGAANLVRRWISRKPGPGR